MCYSCFFISPSQNPGLATLSFIVAAQKESNNKFIMGPGVALVRGKSTFSY